MPYAVKTHKPLKANCPQHVPASMVRASSTERGYGWRWRKARRAYLAAHPLCVLCEAKGRIEGASVVDHIVPHKGDSGRMWDRGNWQALCKRCHDVKTANEDGGFGRQGR